MEKRSEFQQKSLMNEPPLESTKFDLHFSGERTTQQMRHWLSVVIFKVTVVAKKKSKSMIKSARIGSRCGTVRCAKFNISPDKIEISSRALV